RAASPHLTFSPHGVADSPPASTAAVSLPAPAPGPAPALLPLRVLHPRRSSPTTTSARLLPSAAPSLPPPLAHHGRRLGGRRSRPAWRPATEPPPHALKLEAGRGSCASSQDDHLVCCSFSSALKIGFPVSPLIFEYKFDDLQDRFTSALKQGSAAHHAAAASAASSMGRRRRGLEGEGPRTAALRGGY
uniref:Uncharacterized protein n=1 Tax=Aegilops tauschii subsp. strangulata TaxID=200361 RepID=A0A453TCE6_AEGTS